eukprot:snap_masked-scaffold_2-processed-gene-3.24-mRNA-1 protein AED:1.00 eAED:1.00 QI:0/0/0/0/1/1/2/0/73
MTLPNKYITQPSNCIRIVNCISLIMQMSNHPNLWIGKMLPQAIVHLNLVKDERPDEQIYCLSSDTEGAIPRFY